MRLLKTQIMALIAGAVMRGPLLAQPLVVYDTFGPEDAYDHTSGSLMAGPDSSFGLFSSGFEFVPATTVHLDRIQLPVDGLAGDRQFKLSLSRADRSSGMPGTLLETFFGLVGGSGMLTLDSGTRPLLEAGLSYWLVGVGERNSVLSWPSSTLGLRGNFYSVQGGGEVLLPDQWICAYRIGGTPIPEPSTAVLFVLGLALARVYIRDQTITP